MILCVCVMQMFNLCDLDLNVSFTFRCVFDLCGEFYGDYVHRSTKVILTDSSAASRGKKNDVD